MKKINFYPKFLVLPIATIMSLGVVACNQSATALPEGDYRSERSSVNDAGTRTTTESDISVYRDADGNKKAVIDKETTRDPEGLFNKQTIKSRAYVE